MTTPARPIPALVAPTSITNVVTRALTVAASQIGQREGRDSSGNWNNDIIYGVWYPMNYNPWCAMNTSWDAFKAGIPTTVIPKHASTITGLNWFKTRGAVYVTPQRGDLFFLVNANGVAHHTGWVEKVLADGRIQTIEGNTNTNGSDQGNGVYRLTRTVNSLLKFGRPNWAACVVAAVPATPMPPTGAPVSSTVDIQGAHIHAKAAAGQVEAVAKKLGVTLPARPKVTGSGDAYYAHYWSKRVDTILPLVTNWSALK